MIYQSREELPHDIRKQLPEKAQNLYMKAYNGAYAANENSQRPAHISLHQIANEHAWKTVKREWQKDTENSTWVSKEGGKYES